MSTTTHSNRSQTPTKKPKREPCLARKYRELRKLNDLRYKEVTLYEDIRDKSTHLCKILVLDSKSKGKSIVDILEKRKNNPNLYYVPITDYILQENSQFCSSFYYLYVLFPYPEEDLQSELRKRAVVGADFSNFEMTNLLYNVIYGMSHLQEIGVNHGQLRPEWLAKTTTGFAVMEDPLFQKHRIIDLKENKDLYLSPEAFREGVYGRLLGKKFNFTKSDVFSAGMILLEAGLLTSLRDVYGGKGNTEVLRSALDRKISILDDRYPDNVLLLTTVKRMLRSDPDKRPDFLEIRRRLPDYNQILSYFSTAKDKYPISRRVPLVVATNDRGELYAAENGVPRGIANKLRTVPVEMRKGGLRANFKSSLGKGPSRPVTAVNPSFGVVEPMVEQPEMPFGGEKGDLSEGFCKLRGEEVGGPALMLGRNNPMKFRFESPRQQVVYTTPSRVSFERKILVD